MNIFIRVDASREIGSGHVIRCLTLAEEFKKENHEVNFICRDLDGDLIDLIKEKGYQVYTLNGSYSQSYTLVTKHSQWLSVSWEKDVEQTKAILQNKNVTWLIIDHYAIDHRWEDEIRPFVDNIMVIDDLADRKHNCDLLLDQNYYINKERRYIGLVPSRCKTLLGPQYALLRDEFRQKTPRIRRELNRILVFMGGSDPTNETSKVIEGFLKLNNNSIELDVVVGKINRNARNIRKICESNSNIRYYSNVSYISELMLKADLAFGAGGSTTWERCSLGLPTAVMTIAHNQELLTKHTALTGSIINVGKADQVTSNKVANIIKHFLGNPIELSKMSRNSLQLVDILGVRKVVEQCILIK
ncbi:UDP-2,4-diacetamido-2,4,6-trideoxy-beta-L-altropyranose hydrolase [Aquibacillus albus]|uniref:UDP-2,4-diacetamido-2,4, 6-trideoxy-beta-L-altropyranose hydrolase n=1 Tax=Aquibacillus albus TaxID=1168171 RepID=A0ABS2N1Z7_9BACI|nr:UDP-2,4-diacetamido-2,4,6-trideoxy-beta-L-altropyranose hydrolase [Aquibacillus albus]MBM7572156.1 UDP-2,4-diacetamido-2,4,6-trideoxy-beta-L-altropyranose hydrolase [Aquibacillus albus]